MYLKIKELTEAINQASSEQKPFLFGVNYEKTEGFFIPNPMEQSHVLFSFNGRGNKAPHAGLSHKPEIKVKPIGIEKYRAMFDAVQGDMAEGRVSVVNLTAKTSIETNISEREIFENSNSLYQLYVPDRFVCFSPETFVKVSKGKISTYPMKGTIDASREDAEREILENPKEIAEHTQTVRAMSADLSKVAQNVCVERFRYIDRVQTTNRVLLQTSSEIVGDLPVHYARCLGDRIMDLLPGISIVGSPKEAALQTIQKAEIEQRGYYCGVAGYFDGSDLDSCVLIRFIERDGDSQFFRSGGGITAQSNCEKEYEEVLNKIYLPCTSPMS